MSEIEVCFPGNLKVEAKIGDFVIETDQPEKSGGDGSAPSPFVLFASSIATCAGYFALKFCRAREIDTTGMKVNMKYEWDKEQKRYPKMNLELTLPEGFPEKYHSAILRAMDQCVVKQHILNPPEFDITVV
ncbi:MULTISPECIES: OsmC family protein [Desulfosediminicola]|uniref:OsmC family protein n=1 Tax=Desulfosediminicola TaxID=2886823 RepID=UPI0010AB7C87|nr:OsmC family protein [Desulfosediminicola ganghwensis]